ncbi:acyl-CoA/acyl-ACP dehydrogenase [Endozoicomonas sp. SM1973]|uniref:Acyl-CoA/acyl-ACP dehydrogenase n=1 Tax=Spartinivicinus marinus TaxID=2994442 RepID=A0A853I704_9GAMM|nr:acyl-CoA dehydrogenase family protein [Spartinivicinus marinus]MCX4028680.1 acyl-CoA/acyl-ACP dehydrogenase [Spartinivicinus marinus]NYZ69093.1 acyl-CoA/acyl-ACP dehydrogenase [Spartinivicinus marinus]
MLFTEQHIILRDQVRKFIENEINPFVDEWEEKEQFPAHELFAKAGKLGFLGVNKPEQYGGMGLDYSYALLMAEEWGRINCGGVPMAIGVQSDMCTPALARFGSEELKRNFLAPSIQGELVGCIGVSEPSAGSDVASVKTTARKVGDDYVINGTKMWITNGLQADWMCCLANTGDGPVHKNKSLIVVPLHEKGITRQKLKKLGMASSDTAQLFFDDVKVPQRYVIGAENQGFTLQMMQFQEERMWGAANVVTMLENAIEDTIEYTQTRQTFGKPVIDNQYVHFTLGELATEVEALRALVYRAAQDYIDGQDVTRLASMAKLKAGRLCREVIDKCLQFWGGMGYMWETRISRQFRDGRLMSIGAGADEIMLGIICKLNGIYPSQQK